MYYTWRFNSSQALVLPYRYRVEDGDWKSSSSHPSIHPFIPKQVVLQALDQIVVFCKGEQRFDTFHSSFKLP